MIEISYAGDDLSTITSKGRTLSTAIDRHLTESVKEIGRTKAQVLRSIRKYDIALMSCNEIQSHHIVPFAKDRGATRTPATVGNYMSHLGKIVAVARPAWGIPLDQQAITVDFDTQIRAMG